MPFSLFTKILHRSHSEVSGEIIVKELLGQPTLSVQGIPQSGGIVKEIWEKGVKALPRLPKAPNVLVLGLGGGSVVHLLKKKWPKARVIGVELDPQIAIIGRTYFGLDQIPGLTIITADAFKAIESQEYKIDKVNYDLIIVDLYLGRNLPKFVEEEKFITRLKKMLDPKGVLVFNYLLDQKGKKNVLHFEEQLKRLFPKIKTLQTASNELIFTYLS